MAPTSDTLRFTTHNHLRERILLSILSGKSIRIDGIRSDDVQIGLREYEISLLHLAERITNGSTVQISTTGTSLLFHPGLLPGGTFHHTCHPSRSVGYYLEMVVPLAVFCKAPLTLTLNGVTGADGDMSADMIRTVTLPHMHVFGVDMELQKRGAPPLGGGQVIFKASVVRNLKTIQFMEPGKVKKIRGVAFSTRVSPQFANRMVDAARSVLNQYLPDIYLYTDVYKGEESGKSPGYGLTLVSQSTTDVIHSAESMSLPNTTPEELAYHTARALLEEISLGGCVDSQQQWLVILLMVLGKEDVGRCRFGKLTVHTIQFLRDIAQFFGTRIKIAEDSNGVVLSCVGVGYSNVNKAVA